MSSWQAEFEKNKLLDQKTNNKWSIYNYFKDPVAQAIDINSKKQNKESAKELMASMMLELQARGIKEMAA